MHASCNSLLDPTSPAFYVCSSVISYRLTSYVASSRSNQLMEKCDVRLIGLGDLKHSIAEQCSEKV
jgi:hypothetical protein